MNDDRAGAKPPMRRRAPCLIVAAVAFAALVLAGCAPKGEPPTAAPDIAPAQAAVTSPQEDERKCSDDPRPGEEDTLPRCGGIATVSLPRAYRVVGGSGDPVDQVVCDIAETFVLDGKLFGVELSGGVDGTYRFVRTPNIPGLSWTAGGRYHIEFPDGADKPGTLTTEGGGTTTAGTTARATAGGERFTLTPVEACTP